MCLMIDQRTIRNEVRLEGVGVHSGQSVRLALLPSEGGRIVFRRAALDGLEAAVDPGRVEGLNSTTIVGPHFKVRTVEHLLASLFAFDVNSVIVELDADEIPILDGSALPFVQALEKAGLRPFAGNRPALRIRRPFAVEDNGASIVAEPAPAGEGLWLSYTIEYPHPSIGRQGRGLSLTPETFAGEVAPARTFGFIRDVEALRGRGLALGASFENTVVLDSERIMNGPLRFPDEFVRHKLLDLAGDLALLGRPIVGRFTAHRAGHRLHLQAVRFLLNNPDVWTEE
jgi:UDP-3-O-[3-hydroxymyristoyl] N-acetylglucosamine deacetylase